MNTGRRRRDDDDGRGFFLNLCQLFSAKDRIASGFTRRDASEPPHVHVRRDRNHAKYWLAPTQLADDGGSGRTEIRRITRIMEGNHDMILEEWYGHFGTEN